MGVLPYSRMTSVRGTGEADQDSEVVTLHKDHFREMICDCHELTTALVHEMSSRIREYTKNAQLDDKMMSLGKLSAGLAHELNNPSAAVVRSSKELARHLEQQPERFKKVLKIKMSDAQIDAMTEVLFEKLEQGLVRLSTLDRMDVEEALVDWLYDQEVEEPEDVADNLIDYGFTVEDLEKIASQTPKEHMPGMVQWISQMLTTEKLVGEIEDASSRISNLVLSIKSYTH
ncbi:MAG TPA: cyclic nucleotide-binding protein, partial [Cytophagales bacterium]|nr:cyclic nucleotide-binding protein [Cytophagales bacterium]